jgi:hypothetical protein
MIAGLPWTAWILLIASFGVGLVVELVFYFHHWGADRRAAVPPDELR